jgi:heme-degrading monooxygenase HmoA
LSALLVRLKVADYVTWKQVFDDNDDLHRANGAKADRIFRNAADPNEVMILFDWDNLDRARLFIQSDEVREAMTRAGVADQPDVWFLDEANQPSA